MNGRHMDLFSITAEWSSPQRITGGQFTARVLDRMLGLMGILRRAMPRHVFISYAKADRSIAEDLCTALETGGIACWMAPRDIAPGETYAAAIMQAIRNSRAFVLILSAPSNQSSHVANEVERAFHNQIPIITLRIADVHPSGALEYFLSSRQWLDAFSAPLEAHIDRLRAQLHAENIASRKSSAWNRIAPYAWTSFFSFLCCALLLGVMLWHSDRLVALGLTGKMYYIVLVPLGLSAAGFLFGVLRSYASYRGQQFGGTLELGGPIIAVALVVMGGFKLAPDVAAFPLTVFVHGEGGLQESVLKNSGYVVLDLGPDRRREPIGERGQAYFPAIPANFRGVEVRLSVDAEQYETREADQKQRLDKESLYVTVLKRAGRISGRVQDEHGNPIRDAEIQVADLAGQTNSTGSFGLVVPGDRLERELTLTVVAPGYAPAHYTVVPNANAVVIVLHQSSLTIESRSK
jgi:hypothetical protein